MRSARARPPIIRDAEYNLNNCRVYAPFDTRVTNLTISQGAYAHIGQQMFTLIDTRVWWAVANFRETQLRHIHPGMHAECMCCRVPTCATTASSTASVSGFSRTILWSARSGTGAAGCAALVELGASGDALSRFASAFWLPRRNHFASANRPLWSCGRTASGGQVSSHVGHGPRAPAGGNEVADPGQRGAGSGNPQV